MKKQNNNGTKRILLIIGLSYILFILGGTILGHMYQLDSVKYFELRYSCDLNSLFKGLWTLWGLSSVCISLYIFPKVDLKKKKESKKK